MARDTLGIGLVQATEVAADLQVEVGSLDVVGNRRLIGAGRLPCVLSGAPGGTPVVARSVAAAADGAAGATGAPPLVIPVRTTLPGAGPGTPVATGAAARTPGAASASSGAAVVTSAGPGTPVPASAGAGTRTVTGPALASPVAAAPAVAV